MSTEFEQIWAADKFERRKEADELEGYVKSVAKMQLSKGERGHAFSISVDAPYGVGKSFFLKCLQAQLQMRHPVAYVDAWTDDLIDEPLTALAATLKKALDPILTKRSVKNKWDHLTNVVGKIAVLTAKGAAIKLASAALGGVATEGIARAVTSLSENTIDSIQESGRELVAAGITGARNLKANASSMSEMDERIRMFDEGRQAIDGMKKGLTEIIKELPLQSKEMPIIIIIDELDRCRPSYAIKLLEEVKHLFDVPGLVFIFGLNVEQLSKSVVGAYGPEFDGKSYLRRFINREYHLSEPDLSPLVEVLLGESGIDEKALYFPSIVKNGAVYNIKLPELISLYMRNYNLTAREAEQVVDILQTVQALTSFKPLLAPYLLTLIMQKVSGQVVANFNSPPERKGLIHPAILYFTDYHSGGKPAHISHAAIANEISTYADINPRDINPGVESEFVRNMMWRLYNNMGIHYSQSIKPIYYRQLMETVGEFLRPSEE